MHVSNIGGVFIYSENPKELADWYKKSLEIPFESTPDGSTFYAPFSYTDATSGKQTSVVWSILKSKNRPTHIKEKLFCVNYRVFDMEKTVAHLRGLGITVKGIEDYPPHGKFAWCEDPEGNYIELWEDTSLS